MAVVAVAFNGTRLDDSDTNTDWDNYNVAGGSPASEYPLAYQVTTGTTSGAVNKKVNSSAARQGVERYNATGQDMTAAANRLWFCKVYVSDSFDLNVTWGVEVNMGSADNSNKHIYNIAGTGANRSVYNQYPAQGGYLITAIDPTIDAWAETADSGGTFDQTVVRFFALGAQFVNGTAKAENVAMDAIDIGTGLTLTAGDGASADGKYTDFVVADQDDKTKRWGAAIGSGDNVIFRGIATIGSATATEFTDSTSVVIFPDGYHSAGLFGVKADIQNASTVITDDCLLISEGSATTEDTRADYIVSGTSGTFTFGGTIRNFRNITLTSKAIFDGATIQCQLLTQNSGDIKNCIVRTNSLTSVACLQDPTFGVSTDLNNTGFVQTGAGHAIELDTVGGTYTLTLVTFTGYGADTTDSAALDVTAATGTTTINHTGAQPTYKTAGATVVFVSAKTLTLTDIPNGVNVTIVNSSTRTELQHSTSTGADITYVHSGGETVDILLMHNDYDPSLSDIYDLTLPNTDSSIKFQVIDDPNYDNP